MGTIILEDEKKSLEFYTSSDSPFSTDIEHDQVNIRKLDYATYLPGLVL
jgi:hypothetical protein